MSEKKFEVITEAGEKLEWHYNPKVRRWIPVIRDVKTGRFKRWAKEITMRATASIETGPDKTGRGHDNFICEATMMVPITAYGMTPEQLDDYCNKVEDYFKSLLYVLFDIFKDAFWLSSDMKRRIKEFQKKETFTLSELMEIYRIVTHVREPEEYIHKKLKWSERVQKVGWEYLEEVEKELREELEKRGAHVAFDFELRTGREGAWRTSTFRRYLKLQ